MRVRESVRTRLVRLFSLPAPLKLCGQVRARAGTFLWFPEFQLAQLLVKEDSLMDLVCEKWHLSSPVKGFGV